VIRKEQSRSLKEYLEILHKLMKRCCFKPPQSEKVVNFAVEHIQVVMLALTITQEIMRDNPLQCRTAER
jgi:hypothetical protein